MYIDLSEMELAIIAKALEKYEVEVEMDYEIAEEKRDLDLARRLISRLQIAKHVKICIASLMSGRGIPPLMED